MDKQESGLSAAEEAYFTSGGETALDTPQDDNQGGDNASQGSQQQPTEGEQQTRDEKGRFVPHQALHAEREEHKRTKADLAELREFKARMEERFKWQDEAARAKQAQEKQQEEAPPDPDKDIFAHNKWLTDQLKTLSEKVQGREQQEQQARQASEQDQQIWNYWQADSQEFAKTTADFGDAAKWLAETRDKQLQAFASVDPRFGNVQARNQQIDAELKQIIVQAAQQRRSPAELVYGIAKSYGYAGKAPEGQQQGLTLPDKLKNVADAQAASRGIGQASGGAGGGELDLTAIMAMDRSEFQTWIAEPKNERLFNRLMGG